MASTLSTLVITDLFDRLFQETIGLIERTVDYLERDGRRDREALPTPLVMVFAAESMRLSTQLMQAMAWLMVQKAVRIGELSQREAANPSHRLGAVRVCEAEGLAGSRLLPAQLEELMGEGRALYARIRRLDRFVFGPDYDEAEDIDPVDQPQDAGQVLALKVETLSALRAERSRLRLNSQIPR
jgi:regulator of CtrA degradation